MSDLSELRFGALVTARKATGSDFGDDPATVTGLDASYRRWTKYGNDRLYLNGVRSDDPYVDLATGEISGKGIRSADVRVDGATLVIELNVSPHYYRFEIELTNVPVPENEGDDGDTLDAEPGADGGDELVTDGGTDQLASDHETDDSDGRGSDDDSNSVERFDVLLLTPGIDRGGNYNRPEANIVLGVDDESVGLVSDAGLRRTVDLERIRFQLDRGMILNAGQADEQLKDYFQSVDRGRENPRTPAVAEATLARLDDLFRAGLSPAEAVDYWTTTERGYTQAAWGEYRGATQQAVSDNVTKARKKLDE